MSRLSIRLLPMLLLLPLAVSGKEKTPQLSPGLRGKLLAQNAQPVPSQPPAGAGPAAAEKPPASTGTVPAGAPATPVPATPVPATPVPATPVPATTPAPATTPTPPATSPATPATAPAPARTPRGTPLPSGARTGPNRTVTPAGARTNNSANPATAAPSNAAAAAGSLESDSGNPWENIAFIDAPISDVIQKYEEVSHRHVIRGPNLQGTVTVYANPDPKVHMSEEEAVEFIKAALAIQNFIIQRYSENIDKIIMLDKPPLLEGPLRGSPLYVREEDLPDTDEVVNFILTLKHMPVNDAAPIFAVAVPVHQWGTKYISVPSANSIFVQESVSNIRSLIKVKEKLDLPAEPLEHVWVELERASAEDVQAILEAISQTQAQGGRPGGGGNTGFRSISPAAAAGNLNQPGGQPGGNLLSAGSGGGSVADAASVIVKADPRTNRVFIQGPPKRVAELKVLIHEFDEPSRVKNLLTQQLRYIPVNDFFGLALTSLAATGAGQTGSGSTGGGGQQQGGGNARNTGGRNDGSNTGGDFRSNFSSRNSGASGSQFGGNQFGGGGSSSTRNTGRSSIGSGGMSNSAGGATELPQAQTVGKTLLISDPRTNSLIVSGPPDSIQRVSDLIREMDRRPYQVHINAVIAQMAIGDDMQTSVDYLRRVETVNLFGESVSAAGFFRSSSGGAFIDPTSLSTIAAFPTTGSGFNLYVAAGELFNAYVRALETTSNSKLLAKPHITVANNEIGTISSGERVPIPSNQQSTVVAGGTTSLNSSIEYENVVLSLNVQPLINSKNEITLTVDQLNDTVNGTTSINGNDIPNISTQELQTKITIPNGAILVLGGLVSETERRSNTGFPLLGKIPVLKYLFGSNSKNKQRRELLILLQARIIESADDMVDVNTSEIQRTVIGPDAELFAQPERNTDNVKLPTFERDIPFNQAGPRSGEPLTSPATRVRTTTRLRSRDGKE